MLGHVTSWCWSPNLDAWIALALLANGRARHGETLWAVSPLAGAKVGSGSARPASSIRTGSVAWLKRPRSAPPYPGITALRRRADARRATASRPRGTCRATRAAGVSRRVRRLFDIALPLAPKRARDTQSLTALWLGPASWLLVVAGRPAPANFDACRDALDAAGGALFDVSASRVAWTVAGAARRDGARQELPARLPPARVPGGRVRAEHVRTGERPCPPARGFARLHLDGGAQLCPRCLARALPVSRAVRLRVLPARFF